MASEKARHELRAATDRRAAVVARAKAATERGIDQRMRERRSDSPRTAGSDRSDTAERTDQPTGQFRPAQARELERERMRAAHFDLELNVVKSGRQWLHPRHGIGAKANTRFPPAHQDAFDP